MVLAILSLVSNITANAQGFDAYLGEALLVAGSYCPAGTTESQGQVLPIENNTALFSLLGAAYGGDGQRTFALPNLRDKAPVKGARWCLVTTGIYPPRTEPASPSNQPVPPVSSGHDLFLGQLIAVASQFCPYGTLESKGQMLSIADYSALYSLMGTTYGGDGQENFALPNLSEKAPASTMRWCLVTRGIFPTRD
jgi:microcystin-dependent protein